MSATPIQEALENLNAAVLEALPEEAAELSASLHQSIVSIHPGQLEVQDASGGYYERFFPGVAGREAARLME